MVSNQPHNRIMSAYLDVLMAFTAATMMRSPSNRRIKSLCFLPRPLPPPLPVIPSMLHSGPWALRQQARKEPRQPEQPAAAWCPLGVGPLLVRARMCKKKNDVLTTWTASAVMRSPSNSRIRPAHCGHPDGRARPWRAPGLHFIQASGLQGRAWMVCERAKNDA